MYVITLFEKGLFIWTHSVEPTIPVKLKYPVMEWSKDWIHQRAFQNTQPLRKVGHLLLLSYMHTFAADLYAFNVFYWPTKLLSRCCDHKTLCSFEQWNWRQVSTVYSQIKLTLFVIIWLRRFLKNEACFFGKNGLIWLRPCRENSCKVNYQLIDTFHQNIKE